MIPSHPHPCHINPSKPINPPKPINLTYIYSDICTGESDEARARIGMVNEPVRLQEIINALTDDVLTLQVFIHPHPLLVSYPMHTLIPYTRPFIIRSCSLYINPTPL